MFKFDTDAKAYLAASNDLMEEIEGRGYASIEAAQVIPSKVWTALNAEWAARQAVLDAGPTGNYDRVTSNNRVALVTVVTVATVSLVTYQIHSRRARRTSKEMAA